MFNNWFYIQFTLPLVFTNNKFVLFYIFIAINVHKFYINAKIKLFFTKIIYTVYIAKKYIMKIKLNYIAKNVKLVIIQNYVIH